MGENGGHVHISDFHQARGLTEDGCFLGRKTVNPVLERLRL